MKEWAEFYTCLFNFRDVRYVDLEGKLTGLTCKAMTNPCGKIRIPINESSDDKGQIAEHLDLYHGDGNFRPFSSRSNSIRSAAAYCRPKARPQKLGLPLRPAPGADRGP